VIRGFIAVAVIDASFVRLTILAISGEAHGDARDYLLVGPIGIYSSSELNAEGFVRFIGWLVAHGSARALTAVRPMA